MDTRLKQLSIPKIAIEAGKMTEVVRDVIACEQAFGRAGN